MREEKGNEKRWAEGKSPEWFVSVISIAVLGLFMLLYLILSVYSSSQLAKQTEIISEHPFEVVISAGEVDKHISEMRIYMERLTIHNTPEDLERVETALEGLDPVDGALERMMALYRGDLEDVRRLTAILEEIDKTQQACINFAKLDAVTPAEITQYQRENLAPLYDQAEGEVEGITEIAKMRKVEYGEMANRLRNFSLAGSIFLLVIMVVCLLVSQYVMYRQRRELARRALLFDNLSENIDDAFLIWSAETRQVSYVSKNMERVIKRSVRTIEDTYPGFPQKDVEDFKREVFDREHPFVSPYTKVVEYQHPDGRLRWFTLRIYRTRELSSPLLISVFTDCTDDIRSRQTLQDATETAERANEAKSDFLSRMSHEIRTPLNAIIGMTTIAAASIGDPVKMKECLSKINFSSKHLLLLLNDVLDMSKIESNKMVLQQESFDLFQLVNTFVSTIYPQAQSKGIAFSDAIEHFGAQMQYIGDPLRLNQILLNLASNAVKFTPAGGKISFRVARQASKGDMDILRFTVTDTGIGMSPEELRRIYKPFEQANPSIAGRFGGTGLGVSITKNLVGLMNGHLKIESEPGVGTVCTVELPFRRDEDQAPLPDFSDQCLRALVVDDEQAVCEQSAALLENIKIKAEWALTGEEAVERVVEANRRDEDFDFCLIDWMIPNMDGIEITRRIRASVGWGLPIVMISAYDYTEIEDEARAAGVNAFLPKPLYRSSVYAVIRAALQKDNEPEGIAPPSAKGEPLRGKRLLVAEDNEINREILVTLLSMNGVETECAVNGREAVEMVLSSAPGYYDAVLMDVQMPVMGGFEATANIRRSDHRDAKRLPIIATTANAFSEDVTAALAAGMDAHISKPIDMEELFQILAELL